MGAEVGATTSSFSLSTGVWWLIYELPEEIVLSIWQSLWKLISVPTKLCDEPLKYYDRVIEIDLSELEPYINGPFTPDAATPISEFAEKVLLNGYPRKMEVGLIGSCT